MTPFQMSCAVSIRTLPLKGGGLLFIHDYSALISYRQEAEGREGVIQKV